jgi:hypothetical protein
MTGKKYLRLFSGKDSQTEEQPELYDRVNA